MNGKAPDAFRTISEVADWLGVNAHVLRFWESKFAQVKPVKRAGGRRYYRPSDMELLGGIQKLLHEDGMTIKGVQKILREKGVRAVCAMSKPVTGGGEETAPEPEQDTAMAADAVDRTEAAAPAAAPADSPAAWQETAAPPPESAEPASPAPDIVPAAPEAPDPQAETETEEASPAGAFAERVAALREDRALPLFGHDRPETMPETAPETAPDAEPSEGDLPEPGRSETADAPPSEVSAAPESAAEAPATPPDQHDGPIIAPLPGPDHSLAEMLASLVPGQIDPDRLRPIHARLVDLRARMDPHG